MTVLNPANANGDNANVVTSKNHWLAVWYGGAGIVTTLLALFNFG